MTHRRSFYSGPRLNVILGKAFKEHTTRWTGPAGWGSSHSKRLTTRSSTWALCTLSGTFSVAALFLWRGHKTPGSPEGFINCTTANLTHFTVVLLHYTTCWLYISIGNTCNTILNEDWKQWWDIPWWFIRITRSIIYIHIHLSTWLYYYFVKHILMFHICYVNWCKSTINTNKCNLSWLTITQHNNTSHPNRILAEEFIKSSFFVMKHITYDTKQQHAHITQTIHVSLQK